MCIYIYIGLPSGSAVKKLPAMQKVQFQSLGWEDPLEKGMATHSSIPAWEISWTEEPGGLQSIESQSRTRLKQLRERILSSDKSVVISTIYTHTHIQIHISKDGHPHNVHVC